MKNKYTLRCIAPDGEHQTERGYERDGFPTIDAAWDHANDLGSKWIFYPIAVVTAGETIRAVPHGMPEEWIGRKLATLCKAFAADSQHVCDYVNGETPCCVFPS